jgi:hypothetical protein
MTAPNAEIERLRAEVAQLQRERSGRAARAGRWAGAVALMLVAFLLGVASIGAVFVRNQVLDTNRYVATVAPLAREPVIQDAIANRLTAEVVTHVDLTGLAEQASAWLAQQGAPAQVNALVKPAVSGAESFIHREIRRIVGTDQFAAAWDAANRVAHDQLVAVLTGGRSGAVSSSGTTITVDLGVFLGTVKQHLVAAGFSLAERIPQVSIPYTVYSSPDLPTIRTYVRWLDRTATWLPWVALVLLAAAVFLAPSRLRGLLVAGLFVALGLLLLRGSIAVARDYYLDRLPDAIQSPEAVALILDRLTQRVREAVTLLIAAGFLVAVAAWLAGPGRVPVTLRRLVDRGLDAVARTLGGTALPLARTGDVAARYRWLAEIVIVLLAALTLLVNPSVVAALWLAGGVVVVLAVIEALARLPRQTAAST